jgi:putative Mg2+ transporter-C (MgtC) family protein
MSDSLLVWSDVWRIALALALGAAIGFERELHDKPAGLKTISIVTVSGALLMILSVRLAVISSGDDPTLAIDVSRLAAGVITGIGFLGAGTIIQRHNQVQGITTAAVIWIMAAIGMALGAEQYGLAATAYVATWLALSLDAPSLWLMRRLGLKRKIEAGELEEEQEREALTEVVDHRKRISPTGKTP